MKHIAAVLILLFVQGTLAASDSLAVFHRPEKVIVLINESTDVSTRLIDVIKALGGKTNFELVSSDESVRLRCGNNDRAGSCTFSFLKSPTVLIGSDKTLKVEHPLTDLAPTEEFSNVEVNFESSQGDRMHLLIGDGVLKIEANKRQ